MENIKETKDTLTGYSHIDGRCRGNSTRQIDLAISLLFGGYIVKVIDHCNTPKTNERLMMRIGKRMGENHCDNDTAILRHTAHHGFVMVLQDYDANTIQLITQEELYKNAYTK